MSGKGATITELAATVGVSSSYFTRVFQLSFLAPDDEDHPSGTPNRWS
jgi:hypothetical protein